MKDKPMQVQIVINPEGGWVAFSQQGSVVASDDSLDTIGGTVDIMGWVVVGHRNGIPDWSQG
jgi:hypothetical protein